MLSQEEIKQIVQQQIGKDERLGDQAGGSGHLSFVSSVIDEIGPPKTVRIGQKECLEISYVYTIVIESEFTYYPDNPPREYTYRKTIALDEERNVIRESEKENLGYRRGGVSGDDLFTDLDKVEPPER